MVNRPTSCGFTLIEVMLVVLIIGLLATMAGPFTTAWTASANLHKAQSALDQTIRHARAAALRNQHKAHGDEPAARLLFDPQSHEFRACKTLTGNCDSVWWRAAISERVNVTFQPNNHTINLNKLGLPLQPTRITLSQGGDSHVHELF